MKSDGPGFYLFALLYSVIIAQMACLALVFRWPRFRSKHPGTTEGVGIRILKKVMKV